MANIFELPPLPQSAGIIWMLVILSAYGLAHYLNVKRQANPLTNPLLVSSFVLFGLVFARGESLGLDVALSEFMQSGNWLMLLMGPAMVALALPLYDQMHKIKTIKAPFMISLLIGSLCSAGFAVIIGWVLHLPSTSLWALSTKSITSPMALHLARELPSDPLLVGSLVIVTGLFGSLVAQGIFTFLRVKDKAAQGLAVGVVAHGIGTSLLWRRDPQAAAFAALALVLNGLITVFILPVIAFLWA